MEGTHKAAQGVTLCDIIQQSKWLVKKDQRNVK